MRRLEECTSIRLTHCLMVTFDRPDAARRTLESVLTQTTPPNGRIIIVDNGRDDRVRAWAEAAGAEYLPAPTNTGPAGGLHLGLTHLLIDAQDDDLVVLVDDDDPPPTPTALEELTRALRGFRVDDPTIAGIGLSGARYARRRGHVRRVVDHELTEPTDVDHFGGNQLPVYLVDAVRHAGPPDPDLFFGFEELDFGLRLRATGRRLVLSRAITLDVRRRHGRLGVTERPRGPGGPAWRRYYSARNLVIIARRHGRAPASLLITVELMAGAIRHGVRARQLEPVTMTAQGLLDGFRGRMGIQVSPRPKAGAS